MMLIKRVMAVPRAELQSRVNLPQVVPCKQEFQTHSDNRQRIKHLEEKVAGLKKEDGSS